MTLPTQLKSQYFELITNLLNQIPVQKKSDFLVISSALEIIFEPSSEEQIPSTLKDRFTDISKIYHEPELYVQKEEHYAEFKKIIKNAVDWKIKQLMSVSNGSTSMREYESCINDGVTQFIVDSQMEDHRKLKEKRQKEKGSLNFVKKTMNENDKKTNEYNQSTAKYNLYRSMESIIKSMQDIKSMQEMVNENRKFEKEVQAIGGAIIINQHVVINHEVETNHNTLNQAGFFPNSIDDRLERIHNHALLKMTQ